MNKRIRAVLYTRVSTVEQEEGASLRYQEEQLRKYCEKMDWDVINCYTDKESGRDFDRKDFARLFEYVKRNRGKVDYVRITRWDRFGRNQYLTVKVKTDFKRLGVSVKAIEQNIDETIPEHKLLENIQYTIDEIESDKISIRVKASNYKFAKEGAFLNRAPKGYERAIINGKASLKPNDFAPIIRNAFYTFSEGNYSTEALRKEIGLKGVSKQGFINILRNRVYVGDVKVPAFKEDKAYWNQGLHEPIIDRLVFERVQNILNGNRPSPLKISKRENDFFLRGHVICPNCGHPYTASKSKGRKEYYSYYHCDSKYGCNQRFKKSDFENKLIEELSKLEVKSSVERIYLNILKNIVGDSTKYTTRRINELKAQIVELNQKVYKNQDLLVEGKISDIVFNSINDRYMLELQKIELELAQIKAQPQGELMTDFEKGVSFVKRLKKIMLIASPTDRSLIVGSIFPKKLVFIEGEYRTTEINAFVLLICPSIKGFSKKTNGQEVISNDLPTLAPRPGLEPGT